MSNRIDKKLAKLGFEFDEFLTNGGAVYKRKRDGYTQEVVLMHKQNGRHILQSYDPDLMDAKGIGNTGVGLTYTELRLFAKKMKQLGLKDKK